MKQPIQVQYKTGTTTFNNYVDPMNPVDQRRTGMTVDYMPEETAGWAIWGEDENYLYLISRDAKEVTLNGNNTDEQNLLVLDSAAQTYVSKNYTGVQARTIRDQDVATGRPIRRNIAVVVAQELDQSKQ